MSEITLEDVVNNQKTHEKLDVDRFGEMATINQVQTKMLEKGERNFEKIFRYFEGEKDGSGNEVSPGLISQVNKLNKTQDSILFQKRLLNVLLTIAATLGSASAVAVAIMDMFFKK